MKAIKFLALLAAGILAALSSSCGILAVTTPSTTYWQPPPISTWQSPFTTPSLADVSAVADAVKPSVVIVSTNLATASGWIIDSHGLIVTNQHVVDGAIWVAVTLSDHRVIRASSWQSDAVSDLAVIRLNYNGLPALSLGTSGTLSVGQTVLAIGNSLGQGISVKQGQVSQLNTSVNIEGQVYDNLIESDLPVFEGDSGGPLVNLAGQVVGVTNAGTVSTANIGLAVSIDSALPIIQQLIEKGSVVRPYLGISGSNVALGGVLINQVSPGSPADRAGLHAGDIITAAGDKPIQTMNDLSQAVYAGQPGQNLSITYQRGGTTATVNVTLAARPTDLS